MSETPRKIPQKLSLRRLRRMQVQHRWKMEVVLSTALLTVCTESRESRPRAVSCELRSCCLDATVGARARPRTADSIPALNLARMLSANERVSLLWSAMVTELHCARQPPARPSTLLPPPALC